jgi:hypothetical protein
MPQRRFPPPWTVEELEACFVVRDANGQRLGYFYFEEEPGRRSAAKLLSKDEARRIAANLGKLPELLAKEKAPERRPRLFREARFTGLFDSIRNGRKRAVQVCTGGLHGGNNRYSNASRNQTVFDGGRARLFANEPLDDCLHLTPLHLHTFNPAYLA